MAGTLSVRCMGSLDTSAVWGGICPRPVPQASGPFSLASQPLEREYPFRVCAPRLPRPRGAKNYIKGR